MAISFFKTRSARKKLAAAISQASVVLKMQRDLVPPDAEAELLRQIDAARGALKSSRDPDALEAAAGTLSGAIGDGTAWHPLHKSEWTENFEVLVVAIGVAMAFRCYFLQPFKIPTGSMQPTLYGIHSVEVDEPGLFDKQPLKLLKWAVTGDWYREVRVTAGGAVSALPTSEKPGYVTMLVAGNRYYVPMDALQDRGPKALRDLGPDGKIPAGGVLWSGTVKAGDHVFVNRVAWNFRKPRRGDVMVFSTSGIAGLPDKTHYIKRLVGLPGETVSIRPPDLVVDGEVVREPAEIARIAGKEKMADWAPPYLGYQLIGTQAQAPARSPLRVEGDAVELGDAEYLGMGDNTGNSYDGRYWGSVPAKNMLGPAACVYWPFTSPRFGRIR